MKQNKMGKIIMIALSFVLGLSLVLCAVSFLCFINNPCDMNYCFPSPDKKYTAIVSENNSDYYIHIRSIIREEELFDAIEGNLARNEEFFFSKYAYGKNGSLIIEWERENYNLWVWSGDIGLYLIRKGDSAWEEFPSSETKSEISIHEIPQRILKHVENWL